MEKAHADGALESMLAPVSVPRPTSGLFIGATETRPSAAPKVNLDVRLHHDDLATLDRLVVEYQAADRTQFITSALRHFFHRR